MMSVMITSLTAPAALCLLPALVPPSPTGQDSHGQSAAGAEYVAVHRRLELDPLDLEARRRGAVLALELKSPALALDHVSVAIAHASDGTPLAPLLSLAALAHSAMGEPAAAWNCVDRAAREGTRVGLETADLEAWKHELLADHLEPIALTRASERAAAHDPGSLDVGGLWRLAACDPDRTAEELDRRLATTMDPDALRDLFPLRATLWFQEVESWSGQLAGIAELRRFGPWLDRVEDRGDHPPARVLASILRREYDRLPAEAPGGATWLFSEAEENRLSVEELRKRVEAYTELAESLPVELDQAEAELGRILGATGIEPGDRLLASEFSLLLERVEALAARADGFVGDVVQTSEGLWRSDVTPQEIEVRDALGELQTRSLGAITAAVDRLRAISGGVPRLALSAARAQRSGRVAATLRATGAGIEPLDDERVLALTDELLLWGAGPEDLGPVALRGRLAAVKAADPTGEGLEVQHALARLASRAMDPEATAELRALESGAEARLREAQVSADELRFEPAFQALDRAEALAPAHEAPRLARWRFLASLGSEEAAARALAGWWTVASPLRRHPSEEMELLYRAAEWETLLSVSGVALSDWPLSESGFRFHLLAGIALDLDAAVDRAHLALARTRSGNERAVERSVSRALLNPSDESWRTHEVLGISIHASVGDWLLPSGLGDAALLACIRAERARGRSSQLPSQLTRALDGADEDPLRSALRGRTPPDELARLGASLDEGGRGAFFAALTSGDVEQSTRWLETCVRDRELVPLYRAHAARELRRRSGARPAQLRGRDTAYPLSSSSRIEAGFGRLVVAHRPVSLATSGGAVRFTGVGDGAAPSLEFVEEGVQLIVTENARAGVARGAQEVRGAWIARRTAIGTALPIVGELDARSCAFSGWTRLLGGARAYVQDPWIGPRATFDVARPAVIKDLAADGASSGLRVVQGGSLEIEGGLVDLKKRHPKLRPWLVEDGGAIHASGMTWLDAGAHREAHPGRHVKTVGTEGGAPHTDPDRAPVEIDSSRGLIAALEEANPGDVLRIRSDGVKRVQLSEITRSITIDGDPSARGRLALRPQRSGALRVTGGATLTLRDLDIGRDPTLEYVDRVRPPRQVHVENGGVLVLDDVAIPGLGVGEVSIFVDTGGLLVMRGGRWTSRVRVEVGGRAYADHTYASGATISGAGQIAVFDPIVTRSGVAAPVLDGVDTRVQAYLDHVDGQSAASTSGQLARACAERAWDRAEARFAAELPECDTLDERSAAFVLFAREVRDVGRAAALDQSMAENRFMPHLVAEATRDPHGACAILLALPHDFLSPQRFLERVPAEVARVVRTEARVRLQNFRDNRTQEYLTLATRYELAYPLSHPDRRRAMAYLEKGTELDEVSAAIAADKAREAREREQRERARLAAEKAHQEWLRRARWSAESRRRQRAARSSRSTSSYDPRTSYLTSSSSSPSSTYYSNQAFYARLNSFSGGGSYHVTQSGVTYR